MTLKARKIDLLLKKKELIFHYNCLYFIEYYAMYYVGILILSTGIYWYFVI